ncbi:WD repeat-containing protein 27 [Cladochytrium tenue]|nr:WD repeat-containing protein 27 [Cladochytrium tenue]
MSAPLLPQPCSNGALSRLSSGAPASVAATAASAAAACPLPLLAVFQTRARQLALAVVDVDLETPTGSSSGSAGRGERRVNVAPVHAGAVTAVATDGHVVVTASDDALVAWRVARRGGGHGSAAAWAGDDDGEPPPRLVPEAVVANAVGRVQALQIAAASEGAAAASAVAALTADGAVALVGLPGLEALGLLELPDARLTCCRVFAAAAAAATALAGGSGNSPSTDREAAAAASLREHFVVSAADDRTYQLWSVKTGACLFRSHVIGSAPVCALAASSEPSRILIAAEDGQLQVAELHSSGPRAGVASGGAGNAVSSIRCDVLKRWDLCVVWQRHVEALHAACETEGVACGAAELSEYSSCALDVLTACDTQRRRCWFVVACAFGVLAVDLYSLELKCLVDWFSHGGILATRILWPESIQSPKGQMLLYDSESRRHYKTQFAIVSSEQSDLEDLVMEKLSKRVGGRWLSRMFLACAYSLRAAEIATLGDADFSSSASMDRLAVPRFLQDMITGRPCSQRKALVASAAEDWARSQAARPLPARPQSRDRSTTTSRTAGKPGNAAKKPAKTRNAGVPDQPIAFHSKIRSSGYGEKLPALAPAAARAHLPQKKKKPPAAAAAAEGPSQWSNYQLPLKNEAAVVAALDTAAGITCLRYSADGLLAFGSTDKAVRVARSLRRGAAEAVRVFSAGASGIQSLSWGPGDGGASARWFVSLGMDGHGHLWSSDAPDPLLAFSPEAVFQQAVALPQQQRGSAGATMSAAAGAVTVPRRLALSTLQFWRREPAVVMSVGRRLCIARWRVTEPDPARIEPALNTNSFRVRWAAEMPGAVTAVAPAGGAGGLMGVAMGPALALVDVSAQMVVAVAESAHTRGIHELSAPPPLPHLLFSAAAGDGIRCWDVRCDGGSGGPTPVLQLASHVSRAARLQSSVSACGRYVAAGSEARTVVVYDVRQTRAALQRIGGGGFADGVVAAVDFHPTRGLLAAGCLGGSVRLVDLL